MTDWRAMRERAGLTRGSLASKLAVSVDTVRRWEVRPDKEPAIAYQRQMRELARRNQATSEGKSDV